MEAQIKIELIPFEKMETILPLVVQLNEGRFEYTTLKNRLDNMLLMGSYQCIGAYIKDELVGICGIWILNKLYVGKHIEPDNVYVKPEFRSKKIGEMMMDWLFDYAKKMGCEAAEVNCYVKNLKGKKFWETQGFRPLGIHLTKKFIE